MSNEDVSLSTDTSTAQTVEIKKAVQVVRTQSLNFASTLDLETYKSMFVYIGMGQSLMEGVGHGNKAVSFGEISAGRVLMFKTGRFDPKVSADPKNLFVDEYFDTLVDLEGGARETPVTQAANVMLPSLESNEALLVSNFGRSGFNYGQLKKNGTTAVYANFVRLLNRLTLYSNLKGVPISGMAVSWVHGHANSRDSQAAYAAKVVEMQSTLTSDYQASSGNTDQVLLCLSQNTIKNGATLAPGDLRVAGGQLQAALYKPHKIIMACPEYHLERSDRAHLKGETSAILGAYHGLAIKRTLDGLVWLPLHIISATRRSNLITVTFAGGEGDLVFDQYDPAKGSVRTGVRALKDKGFVWKQTGGTEQIISSVAIKSARVILVTLSGDPGAASEEILDLGVFTTSGSSEGFTGGDPRTSSGCATNIRTNSPNTDTFGNALHDWACHQRIQLSLFTD
jgi:hypothetical protein